MGRVNHARLVAVVLVFATICASASTVGGDYFQVFALPPRPEVQPASRLVLSPDGRPLTLAKDWARQ